MPVQKLIQKTDKDYASCTVDDSIITAMTPLLIGEQTVLNASAVVGVLAPAPAVMNSKRITASKKIGRGVYQSFSFAIPNAKPTASQQTIATAGIGKIKVPESALILADSIKVTYDSRSV